MELHSVTFAICSLFAVSFAFAADADNFAFTDKVGQGNFAFAKLFAFTDDGSLYRLTKRSLQEPQNGFAFAVNGVRNKFAKHRGTQDRDFAFAFAKRSAPFAKRFAANGETEEWSDGNEANTDHGFAKFAKRDINENAFAKFAKREKFALMPQKGLFA